MLFFVDGLSVHVMSDCLTYTNDAYTVNVKDLYKEVFFFFFQFYFCSYLLHSKFKVPGQVCNDNSDISAFILI